MSATFDDGFDLFKSAPDLMLVEVARRAPRAQPDFNDFMAGYIAARRQHEEKMGDDR